MTTPEPQHDCGRVERDALDLHQVLAEAIRRMTAARRVLAGYTTRYELRVLAEVTLSTAELADVLDRTAKVDA